jgi:hypothetical protein
LVPDEATGIGSNAIAVAPILPTDHKALLLKSADVRPLGEPVACARFEKLRGQDVSHSIALQLLSTNNTLGSIKNVLESTS